MTRPVSRSFAVYIDERHLRRIGAANGLRDIGVGCRHDGIPRSALVEVAG